jgi:hypothetical protein
VCLVKLEERVRSDFRDIGRVLEKDFNRLPFTPPSGRPFRSFNWYQSPVEDRSTLIGSVIHGATEVGFLLAISIFRVELLFC